jgi:hypothetical protein
MRDSNIVAILMFAFGGSRASFKSNAVFQEIKMSIFHMQICQKQPYNEVVIYLSTQFNRSKKHYRIH